MSTYSFGKPLVKFFYHLFFRISVEGQNHVPKSGGVLICCNHRSDLDPPLIGTSMARELSFLAKEELFKIPLFGRLLRRLHAFPIRRGRGDRGALRLAIRLLEEGHVLLVFPEGKRNRSSSRLLKGMSGAGFFTLKTDAVVVPCAIIGEYKFRHQLKVVFGPPIDTASIKSGKPKSSEVTAVIMEHIRRLLDQYGK